MKKSRGENDFVNLPGIAAGFYNSLMKSVPTQLQYSEIAQDLTSRMSTGRLLDVGTGPGYLLQEIHKRSPDIELYGLDISPVMVELAARNLVEIEVDLRQGNIASTNYGSNSFDLVTCSGSFYLWDHPVDGLNEIHRILKTGRAAYLFETHRDYDRVVLKQKMRKNLKGDRLIRKILSPRFFFKQLAMTYEKQEICQLVEKSLFAKSYQINHLTIARLPVWLRIKLVKSIGKEQ